MMGGAADQDVDLPPAFLLGEERVRPAPTFDEVRVADAKGVGLFTPMELHDA